MRETAGSRRAPVSIFGVPMDLGQDRRGVDMGPSAIRYARLAGAVEDLGYSVTDFGNIESPVPETVDGGEEVKHLGSVKEVCAKVAVRAHEAIQDGSFPIFLGGDHSISIGTVSGVSKAVEAEMGVIWLDAHADFNTPQTSPTGNIHGMPLATLCGRGHPELVTIGEAPVIEPQNAAVIGLRSVDRDERDLLRAAGVKVYTMREIDARGAASAVRSALADLAHLERIHLSLDLDVVDPEVAPGVGTPVRGGLTYREAHLVMELINEAGVICSLDVVEVNPILDLRNRTAALAVELVESLMGRQILDLPV